jgi:hypothetical protein
MAEEPPAGRHFCIIPLICASLTIALGMLTFIGWISALSLLARVRANYIPMTSNPALCFPLIGLGLITHIRKSTLRWIPRAGAYVVLRSRSRGWSKFSAGFTLASMASGFKKPAGRNADIS